MVEKTIDQVDQNGAYTMPTGLTEAEKALIEDARKRAAIKAEREAKKEETRRKKYEKDMRFRERQEKLPTVKSTGITRKLAHIPASIDSKPSKFEDLDNYSIYSPSPDGIDWAIKISRTKAYCSASGKAEAIGKGEVYVMHFTNTPILLGSNVSSDSSEAA